MNKAIKIVLGVIAAIVAVIIVAVVLVAVFFDANAYRGRIAAKVQQETGRSMTIGAIHLSVFPTLGLKLDDTSLGNAKGFGPQPFAKIGKADIGVRLLPLLLHRQLEVGTIYLSGLQLDLERDAAGKTNWSDLMQSQTAVKPAPQSEAAPSQGGGMRLASIAIGGINISGAAIRYRDAEKHQDVDLTDFSLSTGALVPGKPCAFRGDFKTRSSSPAVDAEVQTSGKLTFDLNSKRYQVQGFTLDVGVSGKTIPGGRQEIKVAGDLDYDGAAGAARLADGQLSIAGMKLHTSLQVSGLNSGKLSYSGPIRIDPFSPRDTLDAIGMSDFRTRDTSALKKASLDAKLSGTANSAMFKDVTLKLDQTTASGSFGATDLKVPAAVFALKVDDIDADRYLPAARTGGGNVTRAKASSGSGDDTPLPVQALDKFSANGTLSIGKLVLHGLKMSDVTLKVAANKGARKMVNLSAKLYGGSIVSGTGVSPGAVPAFSENLKLSSVDIGPLLKDMSGKDTVTGKGDVAADLHGSGATLGAIRRALHGTVSFALDNGAVKGFNLGKILRNAHALLAGGGAQNPGAVSTSAAEETDFSTVSASGKIVNGVLTSDDLKGASPLLRLSGSGTVDLVKQTVDYTVVPTLVNTATGQGGKQMSQLEGISIPVIVSGPFMALSYRPDIRKALEQKAAGALRKQIDKNKGKLNKEIQKGLQGLFDRH